MYNIKNTQEQLQI